MDGEKRKFEIRIQGKPYMIVSTEEDEYVQRVALNVDKTMSEISRANPMLSTAMSGVLAALNISDEYYKTLADCNNLRAQVLRYTDEAKTERLAQDKLKADFDRQAAELHKLQIELAKRDTEIRELKKRLG